MYKIITCDLDETLLRRSDSLVPEINRQAVKKLREKGVKFVVATGRGYTTVQETLKELDLYDKENEYTISLNGGIITENKNNRILYTNPLTFEKAKAIFLEGTKYDVGIHVYTKDMVYGYHIPQSDKDYIKKKHISFIEIEKDDFDMFKDQNLIKIVYLNLDYNYLKSLEPNIYKVAGDIDISYSANRYMEFNNKGINKGFGLRKLCELLNVDPKDTIAIGDNYNDLPMIKVAGLGVGVSNTIESMKPECDYITKANCDEGAVSEVINKFVL